MRQDRSAPAQPLSPFAAVVVTALGVALMVATGLAAGRHLSVPLRVQIGLATAMLAVPAVMLLLFDAHARHAAGLARSGRRPLLLSMLLGASLWVASIGLMEMQSLVVPPTAQYLQLFRALHAALAPKGPLDALVSLAVIAVLPGLCEELVVRGVLLPALAARMLPAAAVLVSAGVFAAMHLDGYRFLFTFAIGTALGFVRLSTGSLWPSVLAHTTLNALTFAVAPLLDDPSQVYTPQPLLGLACLLGGGALTLPVLRSLAPRRAAGVVAG